MYQEVNDVGTSYDALVDLFQFIESILRILEIYTRIPQTAAMTDIIFKTMVEFISVLALATKQVKEGQLSESCPH